MDDAQSDGRVRRRRINARRGFGFSGNSMSDSSEGGDVADINATVEEAALSEPARLPRIPAMPGSGDDVFAGGAADSAADGFTPQQRLAQVGRRSSMYEREYRLGLLHRLLMRKIPLDEIANQLGVSVTTVLRDRKELHQRLREESKQLDIDLIVGNSKETYEEILSLALRAASNSNAPIAMRLAAMRTSLAAENDKHRMLQASGVYDVLRYRRSADGGQLNDIQRLLQLTEELFSEGDKGFSMKDKDADSASLDSEDL